MVTADSMPPEETKRLNTLAEYELIDTPSEESFDRLARLAARLFEVPIALVTLVESDRQFFKAHVGIDICETSRDISFCTHTILEDEVLVVLDASKDARFYRNPLVTGGPHIRFYAGTPLIAHDGNRIGSLCLIDTTPRDTFTAQDKATLQDIAHLVMNQMEVRRLSHAQTTNREKFENIAATSPDAIICSDGAGCPSSEHLAQLAA